MGTMRYARFFSSREDSYLQTAVDHFGKRGLTKDMLVGQCHPMVTEDHFDALRSLFLRNKDLPAAEVLQIIKDLSPSQLYGIGQGLEREDVIELKEMWPITILVGFKAKGLTAGMLSTWLLKEERKFDYQESTMLTTLVKEQGCEITDALQRMRDKQDEKKELEIIDAFLFPMR